MFDRPLLILAAGDESRVDFLAAGFKGGLVSAASLVLGVGDGLPGGLAGIAKAALDGLGPAVAGLVHDLFGLLLSLGDLQPGFLFDR